MKKKVLLITQYFLPDINAASFRMNDLYHALLDEGFDVTVITAEPQKYTAGEAQDATNIHRLSLSKVQKKSFIRYLENYFGFMFKSAFHAIFRLRGQQFDYVIATSPPLFVALGGYAAAFAKRAKFIVDIRDVWPDSAVSAGMLKQNGVPYKLARIAEKFIYKRAHIITCVSRPMAAYIKDLSKHERIRVLYNGISPDSLPDTQPHTPSTSDNGSLTVGYAGNIGIVQNTDILLHAAQLPEMTNGRLAVDFLLIGDGIERERIESEAKASRTHAFTFTGVLPKQEALAMLQRSDLLFFSLIEDPVFDKTIPSKLFDYLLLNKPILTSIKGEGREILEQLGCAIFFDPNSPESLVQAIQLYQDNKQMYDEAAIRNRDFAQQTFNRRELFRAFLSGLDVDKR